VPALSVTATDSVALTYICGNMFRIRNSSFEPRSVRWDIYNANPADTGSLWARGRDVGRTSVDFFVTSRTKGTMRLFVGATLVATKANGNKVACAAPVDTSPLPASPNVGTASARAVVESPSTVSPAGESFRRAIVNVRFTETATPTAIRAFQSQFSAQLIAVYPSFFRFRVRDIGADYSAFTALLSAMSQSASVRSATPIHSFERVRNFGARFPDDAAGYRRSDYLGQQFRTWAARSMRLPEAWWCETGRYGGTLPKIALYEQNYPTTSAADVAPSLLSPVTRITRWRDTMVTPPNDSNRVELQNHGHFVAGLISASGDDSVGLAGPLWRSDLRVVTLGNTDRANGAGTGFFLAYVAPELRKIAPRILTLSSDISAQPGVTQADSIERDGQFFDAFLAFKSLLDSVPGLLIVQAAGNDSYQGSYSARADTSKAVLQEGLVKLRNDSSAYADRIVFVGETDVNGNRASESNEFTGLIDIYAPGFDVPILLPSGAISSGRGTSFAAPVVAGIGGQLLAMDPTLSAAQVKALLLAGAQDSVENQNGDNIPPSRVGNAFDVVYEVDAYGSLRRLSARAGRPLCGATVLALRKQISPNPLGNAPLQVFIRRYSSGHTETISRDENNDVMLNDRSGNTLSVAPGGRGISLSSVIPNLGTATNLFALTTSGWVAQPKRMNTLAILYGERDTVFIDETASIIFATTAGRQPPLSSGFTFPQGLSGFSFSFAPDGSAIALVSGTSSPSNQQGIHIIRRDGTRDSAIANFSDLPAGQHTVWSPDSRRVALSIASGMSTGPNVFFYDSKVVRYAVSSSAVTELERSTVLSDPLQVPQSLTMTAEGGRIQMVIGSEDDLRTNSDCMLRSVRTNGLTGLRTDFVLAPSPCPSGYIPPDNGGGGMDGRIARQKAPVISARISSSVTQRGSADTSDRRLRYALP
jgi:Subtilase family